MWFFVSILPDLFPQKTENSQTLANIAVWSTKSWHHLLGLLFRTQMWHLAPFNGLFWVQIEWNFSHLFHSCKTSSLKLLVVSVNFSPVCVIDIFDPLACDTCMHNACVLAGIKSGEQHMHASHIYYPCLIHVWNLDDNFLLSKNMYGTTG